MVDHISSTRKYFNVGIVEISGIIVASKNAATAAKTLG